MYNIIQIGDNHQQQQDMSVIANATKSANSNGPTVSKIDCAKECPFGQAVIPVPDQWLEVMVTGGFKVWHIVFIIIAFVVALMVVYCCFHRCRIPRTKQEIEADLMRSNLANKFRDYLHELPNEPTTFVEALKKVQEIEEKLEQDDAMLARDVGARKRMGWLKLKGKDKPAAVEENTADGDTTPAADEQAKEQKNGVEKVVPPVSRATGSLANIVQQHQQQQQEQKLDPTAGGGAENEHLGELDQRKISSTLKADSKVVRLIKTSGEQTAVAMADSKAKKVDSKTSKVPKREKSTVGHGVSSGGESTSTTGIKTKRSKQPIDGAAETQADTNDSKQDRPVTAAPDADGQQQQQLSESTKTNAKTMGARTRKKTDKPNLSRTKKAHVKSTEHNQLELPKQQVARHHHHQRRHDHEQKSKTADQLAEIQAQTVPTTAIPVVATKIRAESKSRTKETKIDSTVIHIPEQ